MNRFVSLLCTLLIFLGSFAQTAKKEINGWHLLDQQKDGYLGISLGPAYELLKGRKATTVIVAVIDSGIDTTQEDLRPVLWRNEKEIAGNKKDDDGNGYVDDIYGWNFCGAADGTNLSRNSHEITRVYHRWKAAFQGKKEKDISADQQFLFSQWSRARAIIETEYEEAYRNQKPVTSFLAAMENTTKIITRQLPRSDFSAAEIRPLLKNEKPMVAQAAEFWMELFEKSGDSSVRNTALLEEVSRYKNDIENRIDRKLNAPQDWRGALTRDRYEDISDRSYGNNNLKSGSGDHGTMVAGVIGAVRNNGIGIDGIADHVRIMAIRAVPGGDEHDKDVALAIRYAVDNGAQIINMSFGKPVSPYKSFVDDAVKYAAAKGVLLVHGSGNDSKDITTEVFYPNPFFLDGSRATNFLSVGASGDQSLGAVAAPFSNYSTQSVDIFAPGMHIYTTATDNRYNSADGTSLAAPVVTGVAALLKSYFPELPPEKLISLLTTTGTPVNGTVKLPGNPDKEVLFSALSVSGKVVNAYEAVKAAMGR